MREVPVVSVSCCSSQICAQLGVDALFLSEFLSARIISDNGTLQSTSVADDSEIGVGMTEFEAHVGFTRRSFVAASALAMGAVAGVAGCANGGASVSSNTASGSSESSESSSAESAKPTELRAALDYPAPVAEASPVGNTRALWVSAGWHVYEALYELDYVTYSAHNALAAGEPVQLSDLEFEVALREGAKFSDGSAVTAADVVNAFNRDLESATYASMLSFIA